MYAHLGSLPPARCDARFHGRASGVRRRGVLPAGDRHRLRQRRLPRPRPPLEGEPPRDAAARALLALARPRPGGVLAAGVDRPARPRAAGIRSPSGSLPSLSRSPARGQCVAGGDDRRIRPRLAARWPGVSRPCAGKTRRSHGLADPAAAGTLRRPSFPPERRDLHRSVRDALHAATLSLLAVCWFLAARRREAIGDASRRRLDLAAILCFVLAVGCYEAAVVVPAVLLVGHPAAPRRRPRQTPRGAERWRPLRAASLPTSSWSSSISRSDCWCSAPSSAATRRSGRASSPRRSSADRDFVCGARHASSIRITSVDATSRWSRWSGPRRTALALIIVDAARGGRAAARRIGLDRPLPGALHVRRSGAGQRALRLLRHRGRRPRNLRVGGADRRALAARSERWRSSPRSPSSASIGYRPAAPTLAAYERAQRAGGRGARRRDRRCSRARRRRSVLLVEDPPDFVKGERLRADRQGAPVRARRVGSTTLRPVDAFADPARTGYRRERAPGPRSVPVPGTVRYRWDSYAERLMPVAAGGRTGCRARRSVPSTPRMVGSTPSATTVRRSGSSSSPRLSRS